MTHDHSIEFFDRQFNRPPTPESLALNPFELAALPHLGGDVLDYGCGLGNLAFAAAARGCRVTALDASPAAIAHVEHRASADGLAVRAIRADLRTDRVEGRFDSVVAIGLLMFFDCPTAWRVLDELKSAVRPGGVAAINVLVEGTTYLDMFDPAAHCLFAPDDLRAAFAGWELLVDDLRDFDAPGGRRKRFATVVARRPAAA